MVRSRRARLILLLYCTASLARALLGLEDYIEQDRVKSFVTNVQAHQLLLTAYSIPRPQTHRRKYRNEGVCVKEIIFL